MSCPANLGFSSNIHCCIEREAFCTNETPCGQDEGDCDFDSECQNNLFCGYNNCPVGLGFDSEIDCCSNTQLVSPNYPNSYPTNVYKTWQIIDPSYSSKYINLQFQHFHVRLILES